MKKLAIMSAAVILTAGIYAGIHFGFNSDSTAPSPTVAGAHTTYKPKTDSNSQTSDQNTDQSADNSAYDASNDTALGYSLNVGTKSSPKVAIAKTGTSGSTGGSSSSAGGQGGGVTTTPTDPVTTPQTPPSNPTPPVTSGATIGANIISNPSVETSANNQPTGWTQSGYGTNTTTYTYANTGHTGSHSLQLTTTARDADATIAGDAKWGFISVPVTGGQSYQFSDFYQSTVDTEVDAAYSVNGVTSFYRLGSAPASPGVWNSFTSQFTAPAGATSVVIYHILNSVGSLTTDDYFLGSYTPAAFNRGIVTLNFDDGWLNQYQNAVPTLEAQNLPASFFIITDSSFTNPDPLYMNSAQILDLKNHGFEIGNHSKTHPDLTTLTAAQQQDEMVASQTVFQNAIGVTPSDFAYPFGAYNSATLALGSTVFQSQRTVVSGFNTKDTLNLQQLKIEEVDSNITTAQVQAWINEAIAQKTWLILVYHEIATTPADPTDALYTINPADFVAQMAYLKASGVAVETTQQAIAEVLAQY